MKISGNLTTNYKIAKKQSLVAFEHKLPAQAYKDIKFLIKHMNSNTKAENGTWSYSACLNAKKDNKVFGHFLPGNFLSGPVKNPYIGTSEIEIHKKHGKFLLLKVDNKTGEIVRHNKKWLTSWKSVEKKVSKFIEILKNNLNNPEIIEERKVRSSYITKEENEILQKAAEKVYNKY